MQFRHTYISNLIQRRVTAQTEVRAGNVVADSCRDSYHRYAELCVLGPSLREHHDTIKCLQVHAT